MAAFDPVRASETVHELSNTGKSNQAFDTNYYRYGYGCVRGKRRQSHSLLKQAQMLPIGTHELFYIQ